MANEKVIKAGGMDPNAIVQWGLPRAKDMESWDRRIAVAAAYPIFRHAKRGLTLRERYAATVSDALRLVSMVYLQLGRPPGAQAQPKVRIAPPPPAAG